jgi:hypothetical protein
MAVWRCPIPLSFMAAAIKLITFIPQPLNDTVISGFGVHVESSFTAIYYQDYEQKNVANIYLDNFNPIDCGDAAISSDYKTLTITYHPILDPGVIDFNNKYNFIGTKQ